jgi:hypothetical protein
MTYRTISGRVTLVITMAIALAGQEPGVEILNVDVARESNDEVELRVGYRLTNTSDKATMSAITMFGDRSTGYWAYRPITLTPGTHDAVITISRNADAPAVHRSNAFKVSISGAVRLEHTFAFDKLWCAQADACDEGELLEARSAALTTRLTSPQPSIRAAAIVEAEALDDAARRELLPGVAQDVNHAELRVRFNAMRLLEDWGLRDPLLTSLLVQAMTDPHPGVSRVATSVLARLAEPTDALAEDALTRALESSDDTTRSIAQGGLDRLGRERRLALKPKLDGPTPMNDADCIDADGHWGRFGLYQVNVCDLPTPDAGRTCTDSGQCISACVSELPTGDAGTCFGRTILRGTCLNYVKGGRVEGTLCVD